MRVVFDSQARLPLDSALVGSAPEVPLTIVVSRAAERPKVDALKAAGAEVVTGAGGNEEARARDGLEKLGELGVQSVLLEGGPRLAGAFLDAGEVDEMRLFIAPIAVGGRAARVPFEGEGSDSIAGAQQALSLGHEMVGDDLLIYARLKEW